MLELELMLVSFLTGYGNIIRTPPSNSSTAILIFENSQLAVLWQRLSSLLVSIDKIEPSPTVQTVCTWGRNVPNFKFAHAIPIFFFWNGPNNGFFLFFFLVFSFWENLNNEVFPSFSNIYRKSRQTTSARLFEIFVFCEEFRNFPFSP